MPRRCSLWGIYMRKIYLCKKTAVKEGGGCLLEGGVFSRTYGTIPQSPFSLILCIVFTHECRGRFLKLHVYILGHNLHTELKVLFIDIIQCHICNPDLHPTLHKQYLIFLSAILYGVTTICRNKLK